jgi:CYTH domain-containing protein
MKRFRGRLIPIIIGLILLQTMIVVQGKESPVESPPDSLTSPVPTMPDAVIVNGTIKTDFTYNQEAEALVKSGFIIKGGYGAQTDENGVFWMVTPKNPPEINITIEKPGYLTRTLRWINIDRHTTSLFDISMWAGDLNGDNSIDIADVKCFVESFNTIKGESLYSSDADFNKDDAVNLLDLMILTKHLNTNSQSYPEYNQVIPTPKPTVTPAPTQAEGMEIERKFLLDPQKIPYDLNTLDKYEITQSYISFSPEIRLRKVDSMFYLTVKAAVDYKGLIREERNFWINGDEYNTLVKKVEGNTIYKTRYQGPDERGEIFAIDIFKGDLEGLAYFEMEFKNEELANSYTPPSWVGKEVTSDKRYKNGSLAQFGIPKD